MVPLIDGTLNPNDNENVFYNGCHALLETNKQNQLFKIQYHDICIIYLENIQVLNIYILLKE